MSAKRMKKSALPKQLQLSKARLDELIDDALTDAYGEPEQVTGFYTMLENDLHLPFETQILGVKAAVEGIDVTEDNQLVAVCRAGTTRQRISLSELPLPSPPPAGAEWIAAYRYWRVNPRPKGNWPNPSWQHLDPRHYEPKFEQVYASFAGSCPRW